MKSIANLIFELRVMCTKFTKPKFAITNNTQVDRECRISGTLIVHSLNRKCIYAVSMESAEIEI